jgi:hypothetical protein
VEDSLIQSNVRAVSVALVLAIVAAACGGDKSVTAPTPVPKAPVLTAPQADSPADDAQLDSVRPTLTVRNGTSDQPEGARTYEFQISDNESFANAGGLMSSAGFALAVSKQGVVEDAGGKTSFGVDQDLQPTTRYYWRARLVQGATQSDWSQTARLKTKLVGYNRAGELYDPLIHGETVGDRTGPTTWVTGKGIRLDTSLSYIRYLLPQPITNGEFSMEVEGLRANAPGDKSKVFGMQEGQGDFIVNRYRVDVQYRGTNGSPPNAITFRALYGSTDDLDVRYEPATATRYASVFALDPNTTYYWKATWGTEFRVVVKEGGVDGARTLYNIGVSSPQGTYRPTPHYAYLGVWLGSRARPQSLGSALR